MTQDLGADKMKHHMPRTRSLRRNKKATRALPESWTAGVLGVGEAVRGMTADWTPVHTSLLHVGNHDYPLTIYKNCGGIVIWVLDAPTTAVDRVIGSGKLSPSADESHHLVYTAGIRRGWRRKGLYQAVLRELRRVLGPIRSDESMTKGAVRAWKAIGGAEEGKQFRINSGLTGWTWAAVLGGAVIAAVLVRKLVQEPVDRARGVTSP